MAVYTSGGGAGGPFTQVACDDDGGPGFASQVTLDVTAGAQYWIQVSKAGTSAPGPDFTAVQIRGRPCRSARQRHNQQAQ